MTERSTRRGPNEAAAEELEPLGVSSKVNSEWEFLEHLHDVGYRITDAWLKENFRHLGKRSTLDVESVYLH